MYLSQQHHHTVKPAQISANEVQKMVFKKMLNSHNNPFSVIPPYTVPILRFMTIRIIRLFRVWLLFCHPHIRMYRNPLQRHLHNCHTAYPRRWMRICLAVCVFFDDHITSFYDFIQLFACMCSSINRKQPFYRMFIICIFHFPFPRGRT